MVQASCRGLATDRLHHGRGTSLANESLSSMMISRATLSANRCSGIVCTSSGLILLILRLVKSRRCLRCTIVRLDRLRSLGPRGVHIFLSMVMVMMVVVVM